jgi:hypothetical protein
LPDGRAVSRLSIAISPDHRVLVAVLRHPESISQRTGPVKAGAAAHGEDYDELLRDDIAADAVEESELIGF